MVEGYARRADVCSVLIYRDAVAGWPSILDGFVNPVVVANFGMVRFGVSVTFLATNLCIG